MTKIFPKVQISFLLDTAASLPNRDQNGRAKRVSYGGYNRQRISSQCYKAALRSATYLVRSDETGDVVSDNLVDLATKNDLGIAVRSRMIFARKVKPMLVENGMSEERANLWVEHAKGLFGTPKTESSEQGEQEETTEESVEEASATEKTGLDTPAFGGIKTEPGFTNQPLVLGEKEILAIVNTLAILDQQDVDPADIVQAVTGKAPKVKTPKNGKPEKKPKAKKLELNEAAKTAIANLKAICEKGNAGIDGAFFGRFATADFMGNVDSAVQVAHLIGVSEIAAVADYFTVQDTILKGESAGGAHQNNTELASSLFLGTIVVDTGQLAINFGGNGDHGEDLQKTNQIIAECVAWLVRAVHNVNPSAKLGSTAPYGNVVETVVEVGKRQPHAHSVAFQRPLRTDDYKDSDLASEASRRLLSQVTTKGEMYGAQKYVFNLKGMESKVGMAKSEVLAEQVRLAVISELEA